MGLDGVELLMEIESTFGISVSDEEAGNIVTVGNLETLLLRKLEGNGWTRSGVCVTQHAFYRVRRILSDYSGIPVTEIGTGTIVGDLLPRTYRAELWKELVLESRLRFPELTLPFLIKWLIGCCVLASFGLSLPFVHWGWALLLSMGVWILLFVGSLPLARNLPPDADTVGQLARGVLACNFGLLSAEAGSWSVADIQNTLKRLISMQLGIPEERLVSKTRLVSDLGLD